MATQEFYIRNETDSEARGPFNFEQLSSLVDSNQVTPETLFYDATAEQWLAINSNQELKESLFPEKKKLTVRPKERLETVNKRTGGAAPITVNDMLAAAEGRTAETSGKRDKTDSMARAAATGRWAAILTLLLAGAGEVLPSTDALLAMDTQKLLSQPLVLLGVLDFFLAVILSLGAVTAYPFVRFRAALGLGFTGFILLTTGTSPEILGALAAGTIGLYCSTVFVRWSPVIIAAALGLGGFGFVAWTLLS